MTKQVLKYFKFLFVRWGDVYHCNVRPCLRPKLRVVDSVDLSFGLLALRDATGALKSTEEARQCWNSREQNALRKSRLEAELRSLQDKQRQHQTRNLEDGVGGWRKAGRSFDNLAALLCFCSSLQLHS